MNKISELNQQIKALQEQIKELQKSFPITYYEQNPSL
jgi:peptidoglycan hydrolase CwlO-like protein